MILAGKVLVNGQKVEKAGAGVEGSVDIRLLGADLKYVSRGGLKLEAALEHWQIDVTEKICLDVGASTGGFTDCLLQHGAARVIAVDTGHGVASPERLFQPFQEGAEATGIGLYLSRAFLRAFDGDVVFEPRSAGCSFAIVLAADSNTPLPPPDTHAENSPVAA